MKPLVLAALFAVSPASSADGARDLLPGRYRLKIDGLVCWACARAIAIEVNKVDGIVNAKDDFAHQAVEISVNKRGVTAWALRRALTRAERLANLGGTYRIAAVQYQIDPVSPPSDPRLPKKKPKRAAK